MASDATQRPECLLLHVVPWDGIGGAEMAARTSAEQSGGLIRVHSLGKSLHPRGADGHFVSEGRSTNPLSPAATIDAIRKIRLLKPEVVVFSLWRTFFAFVATRMLFPGIKTSVFLHCCISVHWIDRIAAAVMMRFADEVWADSEATLRQRVRRRSARTRTISMLLHRPAAGISERAGPQDPGKFVCWCRISKEKRIDRSLALIAELKSRIPEVSFTIIGPDHGLIEPLSSLAMELGIGKQVRFVGGQDRSYIEREAAQAAFFLQLSSHEGLGMAVVEAMQLGLVPVVTPVGMIADYCVDGVNSVVFTDVQSTAEKIEALAKRPGEIARLSHAARAEFAGATLYTDDVLDAARSLAAPQANQNPSKLLR